MSEASKAVREVTVSELKERLDRGERPTLIDVREPFEWNIANLGGYGARLIPLRELVRRSGELDKAEEIILYCRSGNRSGDAAQYLKGTGFEHVSNLKGGMLAWATEIDPSLPTY